MSNKNTVSLSQNSETTLMGNMAFKIADDVNLRFYPKVSYVIGTQGPVGTTAGTSVATVKATPKVNASTIATVAPTAGTPAVITAAPTGAATPTPTPTPKEPGFEAVFAIAGLLAVAFLVLRQRK